jgi:hypothetical protein
MPDPDQAELPRKWAERLKGDNTLADLIGTQEELKRRATATVSGARGRRAHVSKSRTACRASLRAHFFVPGSARCYP